MSVFEAGEGLIFEPLSNGKIKISFSKPKTNIQVDKSIFSLKKDNSWVDIIKITNFKDLRNVKIQVNWNSTSNLVSTIDNEGNIKTTTTNDYRYDWDYEVVRNDYIQINASNALAPIKLTLDPNCEGRIAIATDSFSFGVYSAVDWQIYSCGGCEISNKIISKSNLKEIKTYDGESKLHEENNRLFLYPAWNSNIPQDGTYTAYGSKNGYKYSTIVVKIGYLMHPSVGDPSCPTYVHDLPSDFLSQTPCSNCPGNNLEKSLEDLGLKKKPKK